jgi:L-ribulokinase
LDEAPEIYQRRIVSSKGRTGLLGSDGKLSRNTCTAGYKGIWHNQEGYPSKEFFKALDPRLENYVEEKLNYPMVQLGTKVGGLTAEMAAKTGLLEGTAVAAGNVDAHVTVPALKITVPEKFWRLFGTSTCHI